MPRDGNEHVRLCTFDTGTSFRCDAYRLGFAPCRLRDRLDSGRRFPVARGVEVATSMASPYTSRQFASTPKENLLSAVTEMNSIVIQGVEGDFGVWRYRPLDELGLKEKDLERAIVAQPMALVVDPLELLAGEVAVYSQPVLSFHGSVRKPDVVIVTDHGDVVVVEAKRLINAELRDGRWAIAQGVEYASLLSSAPETDLVGSLTRGEHSSWDLLCRHDLGQHSSPKLADKLRNRVRDGDVHLVIACEEAPPDLGDLVRAAANSARLAFALHIVEVRPMVQEGAPEATNRPIAWVPWPRLDTEIVHRTAVTVRVQGAENDKAPSIVVDIQDDSGAGVEEKITTSSRSARRRKRLSEAQRVLTPLAESLDLTAEQLWDELGEMHRAVELEDWKALNEAIARPDDDGPNQRLANVREGRYGVNLLTRWEPSIFVGAYLHDRDHRQSVLAPDTGGDFALIVDIRAKAKERKAFADHPCFRALRRRLQGDAGDWDFADHHAQPGGNSYHPLHLRRPLRDVIGDTHTLEERTVRWVAAARDVVELLLRGAELAELRRQWD